MCCILTFTGLGSWVWKDKKKTDVKSVVRGNYVAVVTRNYKLPTLGLDGKVMSGVDAEAEKIARAKVSGSKVTITPLQAGEVYVWMLWYPKSDTYQSDALAKQANHYAVTKVKVGIAPTNVRLYPQEDGNPVSGELGYTAMVLPAGETADVYIKGTTGSITKKANTMQVIDNPDIGYYCTVPAKYTSYFQIEQDSKQKNHFSVSVSEDILSLVKAGKIVSVPITFNCTKNGKKAKYTFKIGNPVKNMKLSATAGTETRVSQENDIVTITLNSAQKAASTGYITEEKTFYHTDRTGTDSASILKIPNAEGFTYTAAGKVKAVGTLTAQQKKISIAAVKGKPGNYKVTAAKGTQPGTETCFILFHNAYCRSNGTGYQIIKVVVGND